MPINETPAERLSRAQTSHRQLCHVCGRRYYDSLVGTCPERGDRHICMYCCRMCEQHYTEPGQIGQGCRVKDALRAEKRRKRRGQM